MAGFYFSKGIEFTFPATTLNPQSFVLVSKSSPHMLNTYNVPSFQWNTGSALTNQGEAVVLKDLFGYVVDSVYYLPTLPWDTLANGKGPSLELCDPNANNALAASWRHAIEYQAKTPQGDSLWASPLAGCSYLPVAGFITSDSTISIGQSVMFTDASTGDIDSWLWEFERGSPETYSGQIPPPVTYNIMGAYDVTLTVRNTAGKSVKYKPGFIQVGPIGLADPVSGKRFAIIPNPTINGRFTVKFESISTNEVTILTSLGAEIASCTYSSNEIVFNLPEITRGVYVVRAKDMKTGTIQIQKLIVQ
jgi:PKD repeat protein